MSMVILTLKEARLSGSTWYRTGKPCKHGHTAKRVVASRMCVECQKVANKTQYDKNIERNKTRSRVYRKAHREQCKELWDSQSKQWQLDNIDTVNGYKYAWRQRNKGAVNSFTRRRQLAKINKTPKWLTEDDYWFIKEIYALAQYRSKVTGHKWVVDHVIPIQGKNVSGLHVPENLQVITNSANIKKSNNYVCC
jgi:hypothetical protein